MARRLFSTNGRGGCFRSSSASSPMPATKDRRPLPPPQRPAHGRSRSSNGPISPRASLFCPNDGWSSAPSPGSTDVEDLPRTGKASIARRSLSCASPQSVSCCENFAIPHDVPGQTLRSFSTIAHYQRLCRWSVQSIGVTLIPEMAVAVETRAAAVSVARFKKPRPSRTVGMVWRKTNPKFLQLSEIVHDSASKSGRRNGTSVGVGPRAPKH